MLKENEFKFDIANTSVLRSTIHTTHIVLDSLEQIYMPEVKQWRLNERHYGAL